MPLKDVLIASNSNDITSSKVLKLAIPAVLTTSTVLITGLIGYKIYKNYRKNKQNTYVVSEIQLKTYKRNQNETNEVCFEIWLMINF